MRRVSVVSSLAAAVVIGHLGYHWIGRRQTPPPAVEVVPEAPRTCRLEPPLTEADWKPMLDALRPLVAREEAREPYFAGEARELLRRFEACNVDVREREDHLLVLIPLGGEWTGARFRKTDHGWVALGLDGGDIR